MNIGVWRKESSKARKVKQPVHQGGKIRRVPAINNHGGFCRWAFIEIDDPWNAKNLIRASIK